VLESCDVAAAVPGHDAVISALGQSRPSPVGQDLYPGAAHIIEAMRDAGVTRLVWISSHGVGDSRGRSGFVFERIFAPLRLRAELADKERQEALVTASDLDWTIVRPARLTNSPATGRLRVAQRMKISIRDSVSRADVAQFVVTELEQGTDLLTAPTIAAARSADRWIGSSV
jgi:putative NADH-flavin reductase